MSETLLFFAGWAPYRAVLDRLVQLGGSEADAKALNLLMAEAIAMGAKVFRFPARREATHSMHGFGWAVVADRSPVQVIGELSDCRRFCALFHRGCCEIYVSVGPTNGHPLETDCDRLEFPSPEPNASEAWFIVRDAIRSQKK